jgi:hypothetical protein
LDRKQLLERLASEHVARKHGIRTAGEIRHVKDSGPLKRKHVQTHDYNPKDLKVLTKVLWQLAISLGHLTSATNDFVKVKSVRISPDGRLGGSGYDKSIKDIRKDLYTAMEAISGLVDTLHDEVTAPHWHPELLPPEEEEEVTDMVEEVEEIKEDPDAYGDKEYEKANPEADVDLEEEEEDEGALDEVESPLNSELTEESEEEEE